MEKGQEKRRRKANKQRRRTREERDLVKEKVMERFERTDAERRALFPKSLNAALGMVRPESIAARAGSDPPPILDEPDTPVRAPLKPKPHLRSGAIALLEPEQENAFLSVNPKSISK